MSAITDVVQGDGVDTAETPRAHASLSLRAINLTAWNPTHEAILTKWSERAIYFEAFHDRTAEYYLNRHWWLGGFVTFLAALLTTVEVIELADASGGDLAVTAVVLAMATTGLTTLHNFLHYEERGVEHRHKASKYAALRLDIQEMVSYRPEDREPVRSYMLRTRNAFNDLSKDSRTIPYGIIRDYIDDVKHAIAEDPLLVFDGSNGDGSNGDGSNGDGLGGDENNANDVRASAAERGECGPRSPRTPRGRTGSLGSTNSTGDINNVDGLVRECQSDVRRHRQRVREARSTDTRAQEQYALDRLNAEFTTKADSLRNKK